MGKKFTVGALVGVVAGVIGGILTAPRSGKETRSELKHQAVGAADKIKSVADDYTERTERAVEAAKDEFTDHHKAKK